jgi:hypothetical protein
MAVAQALGIAAGSPIFLIERTSYITEQQPIDYEKLHDRGDQSRFVTDHANLYGQRRAASTVCRSSEGTQRILHQFRWPMADGIHGPVMRRYQEAIAPSQ